ncbi:hypothetical protein NSK_003934 [Nannochloropsis salina CCMP1776]|uniref:Uncharacterized protein n=1 Tax=Nannochloropsis salina CCMP1776 TaxID=1027361 RepID=A0A4D9CZU3_9STRA|nr:hypothetical protein NSK_003934 [Nannochloropsis salina CCMP1776]|eukprot:TFJ84902.1 hypothetical protein NSK_003934 [Nannochloropsis salina CCMP1776]
MTYKRPTINITVCRKTKRHRAPSHALGDAFLLVWASLLVLVAPPPARASLLPRSSTECVSRARAVQPRWRKRLWGVRGGQSGENDSFPSATPPGGDPVGAPPPAPSTPSPGLADRPTTEAWSERPREEETGEDGMDACGWTEGEEIVLVKLHKASTWGQVLQAAGCIESIRDIPDFHMRITHASLSEAMLAARALERLATVVMAVGGDMPTSDGQTAGEAVRQEAGQDRRAEQLWECATCHLADLGIADLSRLVHALAVLRIGDPEGWDAKALAHTVKHVSRLGWEAAWWREGALRACRGQLAGLEVKDLANVAEVVVLWGKGGKEGGTEEAGETEVLLLEMLVCAEARRSDLQGTPLVEIFHCFAVHNFRNASGFMERALPEILARNGWEAGGDEFSVAEWIRLLWSYTALRQAGGEMEEGEGASNSNTSLAWSLATLSHPDGDLLPVITSFLLEMGLGVLSLPELATMTWALATMGEARSTFFDRVVMILEAHHACLPLQDLALSLWALGIAGYDSLALFPGFGTADRAFTQEGKEGAGEGGWTRERQEELHAMRPSEEVKLLWALGKLLPANVCSPPVDGSSRERSLREEVVEALILDLGPKLATFSSQDMVQTLSAIARLYGPSACVSPSTKKLLEHLCNLMPGWLPSLTDLALAQLLFIYARLHYPVDGIWDTLKEEVERRLKASLDLAEKGARSEDREEEGDSLFHLARCQALLGMWKRAGIESP